MYVHKDVEQVQINKMIDWSYDLVLQSFSKRKQARVIRLICIRVDVLKDTIKDTYDKLASTYKRKSRCGKSI